MALNLVRLQDKLKDLSDSQLRSVYDKGTVPQFLVMTEMGRRKEMKEEYQKNLSASATTVAEDVLSPDTAAARGLGALAQPQNRMGTRPNNLPIEQSIQTMPPSPQPMGSGLPMVSPMLASASTQAPVTAPPIKMNMGGLLNTDDLSEVWGWPDPKKAGFVKNNQFYPELFVRNFYPHDFSEKLNMGTLHSTPANQSPHHKIPLQYLKEFIANKKQGYPSPAALDLAVLKDRVGSVLQQSGDERGKFFQQQSATNVTNSVSPSTSPPVERAVTSRPKETVVIPQISLPNVTGTNTPSVIPERPTLSDSKKGSVPEFKTDFTLFEDRLKTAVNKKQPEVIHSPSFIAAEKEAMNALTDARKALSDPSAYADLASALSDRKKAIGGQRDEAAGLALLEAAARVAGSKSPYLAQAVGETAPAIASYGKSLSEVRRQENALFDSEAKLKQLEVAEKAGRKDEVKKLRGELRDLDKVRRDVDEKAFNRFEKNRSLDIAVIKAEQEFAVARTTQDRENAKFRYLAAKNEREKNSLNNQVGEAQSKISELEDWLRSGKDANGKSFTDANKAWIKDRIDQLKTRRDEIASTAKLMKGSNFFEEQKKLSIYSSYITNIKKLEGELGSFTRDNFITMKTGKYGSAKAAGERYDELQKQIKDLRGLASQLLGGLSTVPPSVGQTAAKKIQFDNKGKRISQ